MEASGNFVNDQNKGEENPKVLTNALEDLKVYDI